MLKLVRLYDIKRIENTNQITSVSAELLDDIPYAFDEDAVLGLRDNYTDDFSDIFVLWDMDRSLTTCEYVVFTDFIDFAEWDFRVYSAVAASELGLEFEM